MSRPSMDKRITNSLQEGPLVALYYITAINLLKKHIDNMTDEEISKMFERLMSPERVRSNIETIYNLLNHPK